MRIQPSLRHLLIPLLGAALLGGAVTAAAADHGALIGAWATAVSSHRDVAKSPKPAEISQEVDPTPSAHPAIVSPGNPKEGSPPLNPPTIVPCIGGAPASAAVRCLPCPSAYAGAQANLVCYPCPRIEAAAPAYLCRPCLAAGAASPAIRCGPCPMTAAATTSCWPCGYREAAAIACPLTPPASSAAPSAPKPAIGQPGTTAPTQAR